MALSSPDQPLIVGAGPVGLAAALFLARQGLIPRVVEKRPAPTQHSKALAVNPRTLEILEPTGVTAQMLAVGSRISGARLHRRGKTIVAVSFADLPSRYPFMLALSQANSERLLTAAFEAAGGRVERGVEMTACKSRDAGADVTLQHTASGLRETVRCPWLLGADGAHSAARDQAGIAFEGRTLPTPWHLADAPIRTRLAQDHAQVFLQADGAFVFMMRVVVDAQCEPRQDPIWRVISNRPSPLQRLEAAEQTEAPIWESTFDVPHRIAATLSRGPVYLAGDAAHVHSPFGARGMNLGIEDAWVFAELARTGRLDEYDHRRRATDRRVVRQVEMLSRMVSAENAARNLMRNALLPLAVKIPFLRSRMKRTLSGLDHDLPDFGAGA